MRVALDYPTNSFRTPIIVGLVNAIGCPIALIIAAIRVPTEYNNDSNAIITDELS